MGTVRVSASEIALIFGWSEQYTKKTLRNLIEDGSLEILQAGAGHRARKYGVPSFRGNQNGPRGNQGGITNQVQKVVQKRVSPFRYIENPRNTQGDNAHSIARIQSIFDKAIDVYKTAKPSNSPFKRFRRHWDRAEKWTGPDFVCYFSFVFRLRFGETPKLDWKKDVGAARLLRHRFGGDPLALKAFIQIAFYRCKRQPDGLHTFTYGRFYQDIKDMEISEEILDEYDDAYVFPWLKQQRLKESARVQDEYDRNMLRVYLGL
jgi:hypothetical protein